MPSQPHIPSEIQAIVLEGLEDKGTLLNCRLVSKRFQWFTDPQVFRTLTISCNRGCSAAFVNLSRLDHIAVHVKSIHFKADEKKGYVNYHEKSLKRDRLDDTISMFSHLGTFPNLLGIRLYFPEVFEEEKYNLVLHPNHVTTFPPFMSPARYLQVQIFTALSYLKDKCRLSTLEIHGFIPLFNPGLTSPGFDSFIASISSLSLNIVVKNSPSSGSDMDEYFDIFSEKGLPSILQPCTHLTHLSITFDDTTFGLSCISLMKLKFPKLQSLRLGNFIFDNRLIHEIPDMGLEDFVIRHGTTLLYLDLSSCWLDIDPHSGNGHQELSWAHIWRRFEKEMKCLRQFKFDPLPGWTSTNSNADHVQHANELGEFIGYVHLDPEDGIRYVNVFPYGEPPHDAYIDRSAFDSLQMTIANRI